MRKKICIISTGGTILGSLNKNGYTSAKLDFNEVFSGILDRFSSCDFKILEPFSVGSQDMSCENLLTLMKAIEQNISQNDAIIITHGTDTLEESAFLAFLLFHKTRIPIIFCGAMYPPKHALFDGEKNLEFSLISSLGAKGVFVAMNNNLIKANEVIKLKSVGIDAFTSANLSLKIPTFEILEFSLSKRLAKVAIIYADSTFEPFDCKGFEGIVLAGMGAGTLNKNAIKYFSSLSCPVVRSTRCAFSYVSSEGEVDNSALIPSFALNPAKSRILLSLAISNGANKEQIQKYFEIFA